MFSSVYHEEEQFSLVLLVFHFRVIPRIHALSRHEDRLRYNKYDFFRTPITFCTTRLILRQTKELTASDYLYALTLLELKEPEEKTEYTQPVGERSIR